MRRIVTGVAILGLFLAGCENNGRGNSAVPADAEGEPVAVKPEPYQGPGGGEVYDLTTPTGVAALATGGQTSSAFPESAPPAGRFRFGLGAGSIR